ncbi:galactose-1-phosphate uridylyltransferase [Clostridioides sp. ES-S-0048-02]|uniref:galactose-1-phosphate uridylyltransferase n=1 Tax=Clostridioides sp. ES-S-0048-02 TaxID=2770777 RepID=UPI001D11058A|nr:galactose-1-phosphate uridylyltransferase [Clostridioides sp. ES-S-0048-02]
MRELRIDSITNDVVIFATDRLKRPLDTIDVPNDEEETNEYDEGCPFCKGNEAYATDTLFEIKGDEGWLVKSIYNKFPIIDDLARDIYGIHEVMIESNKHNSSFYNMNQKEFEDVFFMYRNRFKDLSKDDKVEYVSIFKNFLRKAGASLMHPHAQILSMSFIPPEITNELLVSKEYYDSNKSSLYNDLVENEISLNKRVVYNGDAFLVIIPYATKYSGEVRVIFKDNIKFDELTDNNVKEISMIFEKLFKKLYNINGYMPFNLCIHTHPTKIETKSYFNVHMHIIPRKYNLGGFELGTNMYVSSMNPEELTKKLKFD